MTSLEELTVAEAKSIDLITQKIKYNDPDDVNRVCEYLDNKGRITSEAGRAYLGALRRMCTGKEEVTECIYCDNTLKEDEHIICSDCLRKMLSIKHERSDNTAYNKKSRINLLNKDNNTNESKFKGFISNKKLLIPAIILFILVLVLTVGFIILNRHSKVTKNDVNESVALDGIDFIGQSKELTDSIFGQSVPLIMENSIYYLNPGVSVVYDPNTNIINYVDCDNKGTVGSIQIMGVNIGWTKEELISYFKNMGYDCTIDTDNTLTVRTKYNDKYIEVYIVLEEDVVTLICAYVI